MKMLVFALFVGLFGSPLSQQLSLDVAETAYLSTVKLQVLNNDGNPVAAASGFAINKRKFMTAGHFCEYAIQGGILGEFSALEVVYVNRNHELSTLSGGKIDSINKEMDLCVIDLPKHGVKPLKFAKSYDSVKIHDRVVIVGGPLGFFPVTSEGRVIVPYTENLPGELNNRLAIAALGTSGNSGGPVLNEEGEVIGVVVAKLTKYDNILFCTHLKMIKEYLADEYGK